MAKKHDTDTLTRIDHAPDAPTIRQPATGETAATHKLDPRAYAPLKVCPQCSLAWETTGQWCPSCGTAFDKAARESSTPTRVMSQTQLARRHPAEPPLTRSARRASAAGSPPTPPVATDPEASRRRKGPARALVTALFVIAAVIAAFMVGQATRPSDREADSRAAQAAQTARESAAASYRRAFEKMQKQAADAIESARSKALAEGEANARAQLEQQAASSASIFDSVTACVLHGDC